MVIQSVRINGQNYQIDYDGLANKPIIPNIADLTRRVIDLENSQKLVFPQITEQDAGKILVVNSNGTWTLSDSMPSSALTSLENRVHALEELVADIDYSGLLSEISLLKLRVHALESGEEADSINTSVTGNKLSISGASVSVTGQKLSVVGDNVSTSTNKLTIQ